jgi:hypothetical protein
MLISEKCSFVEEESWFICLEPFLPTGFILEILCRIRSTWVIDSGPGLRQNAHHPMPIIENPVLACLLYAEFVIEIHTKDVFHVLLLWYDEMRGTNESIPAYDVEWAKSLEVSVRHIFSERIVKYH